MQQLSRQEWHEYLIEGWALGCFMISIGLFAMLLEVPSSPLHDWIRNPELRRGCLEPLQE
jgi:hypothetical protein